METIRFDNIEKLKSKVGEEFSAWSKPIEVTQDKINQFADVTGDHQWIHIDIERAKRESPFKGPVAHGFLTLSLIPAFEIPRDWNVTSFRDPCWGARSRQRIWSSRAAAMSASNCRRRCADSARA